MSITNYSWPDDVLVLDPECGHELTDRPGANAKNQPHSAIGWACNEFRNRGIPPNEADFMLRVWMYRYDCLSALRAKYPHTYTNYDVYNAAWVSCGYVDEQDESAIELCRKRFSEPTGEVLADPKLTVKKKV